MTTIYERTYGARTADITDEVRFSSDSHVIEPAGLWVDRLPEAFRESAPGFGGRRDNDKPGAMDRDLRVEEMAADGVSGEFLYPTHGLKALSLENPPLEEACCRVYNDWLIDYCQAAPDRLFGIPMLSMYNIDEAIKEMERCLKLGLKGSVIWQVPPTELSFTSDHYERFWAAAQDMEAPVNLHILSGFGYAKDPSTRQGIEGYRSSVNRKLTEGMNTMFDLIFSGVLERYPRLKIVMVENEIGWMPYVLEQWDYYVKRRGFDAPFSPKKLPSEYFHEQVYATFFNDAVGGHSLSWWGEDNCMWSNDFPHGNSTWPQSREVVARDLGELPPKTRAKLVRENLARLYKVPIPEPIKAVK
ncbi:MAG: amidohydrolase [Chloroflexi bacterium]|nr:amidohydrolase [Chloroflexota bacterium]